MLAKIAQEKLGWAAFHLCGVLGTFLFASCVLQENV